MVVWLVAVVGFNLFSSDSDTKALGLRRLLRTAALGGRFSNVSMVLVLFVSNLGDLC